MPSNENLNVFIKNVDEGIKTEDLRDTFSLFGKVLSCKMVCNENGSSLGYGYIHFETEEAARTAIENVNGMFLNGKQLLLERFRSRQERLEILGDKMKRFNNLYIKNFGEEMTEDEMKEMFQPYGNLISVKIMSDIDGKSRKFGFVSFKEPEAAEKAVDELDGSEVNGQTLFVGRAQKKDERRAALKDKFKNMKTNLYVKGLDNNIDDERLKKVFSQFGRITSAKVMTEGGRSKGFGFVSFSSSEEATKALAAMNGRFLIAKPLYVSFAQTKEERTAYLASKYSMQTQHNFYAPVRQRSSIYRWQRQPAPANGFQNIPEQNVRVVNSVAAAGTRQPGQANISGRTSARPITGQSDHPSCMPVTGQSIQDRAPVARRITGQSDQPSCIPVTGQSIQDRAPVARQITGQSDQPSCMSVPDRTPVARLITGKSGQPSCMPVTGQPVPDMATIATSASVSICGRKRKARSDDNEEDISPPSKRRRCA